MALVTTRTLYFLWLHSLLKTTLTAITTTLFTSLRFSAWFALWTPVNAVNDDTFAWRRFKEGDRDAELSFSSFAWHTVSRLTVSQLSSLFVTLPMCDPFLTAIDFLLMSRPCGWSMTSLYHLQVLFKRELRNWAETRRTIVSGIVTRDSSISCSQFLTMSLVTFPEVFAKVNSAQFPSPVLSDEFASFTIIGFSNWLLLKFWHSS